MNYLKKEFQPSKEELGAAYKRAVAALRKAWGAEDQVPQKSDPEGRA